MTTTMANQYLCCRCGANTKGELERTGGAHVCIDMKPCPFARGQQEGPVLCGTPCSNYPARTGDDCTFCKGSPRGVAV